MSPLSGVQLEDRVLPKYLYPSGGSAYAIRAFVNIPKGYIEGIDEGVYYYHPTERALQFHEETKDDKFSIEFNLYLPAMEPLYKEETLRLAYLELGHILQLLNEKYPVAYAIQDKQDGHYHKLIKVVLEQQDITNKLNIKKITNDNNKFGNYDLNSQSIMLQSSELGNVLNDSSGVLIFEAEKSLESYIEAGYQVQEITTKLYKEDIGSTVLGFNLTDSSIYTMAIGGIIQVQKELSEINSNRIDLNDFISQKLKSYLPQYMLPAVYLTIDHLPLTVNGKVNYNKLPQADLINKDTYVAPRTELETKLCNIFANVLGLKKVGIKDNFFRIGGNSIMALRAIHQINKITISKYSVHLIFKYKTPKEISDSIIELKMQSHELIIPLVKSIKESKSNIYFVHCGVDGYFGGAECYFDLASLLSKQYKCLGVESYNIYKASPNKRDGIDDLYKLAEIYTKEIYQSEYFNKRSPLFLVGWSLGGHIAYEIALLFKKKYNIDAPVIMLDSINLQATRIKEQSQRLLISHKDNDLEINKELPDDYILS